MNTGNDLEKWARPRTVVVLTLVLLGALWSVVILSAVAGREEAIAASSESLQRANLAIEQQTRLQMRLADLVLAACQSWLEENPGEETERSAPFRRLRDRLHTATESTIDVYLLAADGRVFDGGGQAPLGGALANTSAASDFVKRAQPTVLTIGDPLLDRPDGHYRLPIARRLANPTPGAHTVLALIDLSKLVDGYDQQRQKPGGSVTLLRSDGTVLARAPHDARRLGLPLAGSQANGGSLPALPRADQPSAELAGNGEAGELSVRLRMADFPLLVISTVSQEDAMIPWFRHTIWIALLALGMTVPLAVVAYRSLQLLRILARHQTELQQVATTDRLTGIFTRQHFVDTLKEELAHAGRRHLPLTILSFDVDFFKRINDGYGHSVGDQVLVAFAKVAKACLREVDVASRVGAGEFSIVLPNTDVHAATAVAERIRRGVGEVSIPTNDGSVQFTVSVGVSAARPDDRSVDDLLKRVAEALHEAKSTGHDRIAVV